MPQVGFYEASPRGGVLVQRALEYWKTGELAVFSPPPFALSIFSPLFFAYSSLSLPFLLSIDVTFPLM